MIACFRFVSQLPFWYLRSFQSRMLTTTQTNLDSVRAQLAGKSVRLVAVSKYHPAESVRECYEHNQRHFGENYVQELEEKANQLKDTCPEIKWHFIGQVQSNKIPKICSINNLFCVETVESEKHCAAFEKALAKINSDSQLKVNTSREHQKGGASPEEAVELGLYVNNECPHIELNGFMTIGSVENSDKIPNPDFVVLASVRKEFSEKAGVSLSSLELSMGMSTDMDTAIKQGSTSVRVGTAIFGMRELIKPQWSLSLQDMKKVEESSDEKQDDSFRPISMKCGVFEDSKGSAYIEMGKTKVLVEVDGPRESPSVASQRGKITVTVNEENLRIRAQLESAISAMVHLDKYPRAEFMVNVSILSSSGGELSACILASALALVHAHVELFDIPVAGHVIFLPQTKSFVIDPPSPLPPSAISITVALLPNLNQLICTRIKGALSVAESREALSFACKHSLRLYPVMRKSILSSFQNQPKTVL
ncbi:hypothetical protein PENTCL1PPCAC_17577, partial [Pristionchus entomophagus]